MPSEHHIFNPADQSVDKSPRRPNTGAVKTSGASPGSGSAETTAVKTSEESPLPKKGREKLASLLADLLGFPGSDRQPETKTHRLNLYESMSPAVENGLNLASLQESQQDKRAVIYENCLKCQREHCHPPPRATPAKIYPNVATLQTFPNGLHVNKSKEHERAANEEPIHQAHSDASQREDGQCQYEEMNDRTVICEGKRLPRPSPLQLMAKLQSHTLASFFLLPLLSWIFVSVLFPLGSSVITHLF